LLLATTTEYCCIAASLVKPSVVDASLSRSAAQKSQPTLDGSASARWHGVTQVPLPHTVPASHCSSSVPPVPSLLHIHT
jgi:hypothetical protein